MSECKYCFCHEGEHHHPKCPAVNKTLIKKGEGLPQGAEISHGRFQIGMAMNYGGFGIAYIAKDNQYKRRIVIKEFFPNNCAVRNSEVTKMVKYEGVSDESFYMMQEQFYREYDIMTKAAGPGVPAVYEYCTENNSAYIAMDYIEGETFKDYLRKQKKPIPWYTLRSRFFIPLLHTVSKIHSKGILHRDISLVNLMISPDEKITLLDFGAGRDFHEKETVEKLRFANKLYAPIEQTTSDHGLIQGPWTDIFALGTVFYTAVTSHYPPTALERPQQAVESVSNYVKDIPEEFDDALMKALYYYPQHRFKSTKDFETALMLAPEPKRSNDEDFKFKGLLDKLKPFRSKN